MTGRDLIIYILQNNLEDEDILKDGRFPGLLTIQEAAAKANVGVATINAWMNNKQVEYAYMIGGYFIPADFKSPIEGSPSTCTDSRRSYQC